MLNSLSKRWLQMDQDAFISAIIMNPYIHAKCFARGNPQLSSIGLYNIVKCTFARMLRKDPDLDFHNAFFDYLLDAKEFSSSLMGIAELKVLCEKEVGCCLVSCYELATYSISITCFLEYKRQSSNALGKTRHWCFTRAQ